MKVLAINSSPRGGGQSKTEWMLNHLVTGMREAGAEVDVIDLRNKKINYCIGCFTCWTKTPGTCLHKDDMTRELLPKFIESDMVIYATPLYHFTLNAHMKTFIERTLPMLQPFFQMNDDKTRHPLRHEFPKAVWVSVAGFPEDSVFDELSHYVNFIFKDKLLAEIYRPAAESLLARGNVKLQEQVAGALQTAGKELVTSGEVLPETMAGIKQPVFDSLDVFHELGNMFWKTCIAEGVTPKVFEEKEMVPRPDSVKNFMLLMKMAFKPEAARDMNAVMQYNFSGDVQGVCYFVLKHGTIRAEEGTWPDPELTIETPFDIWMDIMTRKADGQEMFMQQRYKIEGDVNLLRKMGELFGRGD
jgi:putative sterol carrier protein/putative NADPH-quinone reductase